RMRRDQRPGRRKGQAARASCPLDGELTTGRVGAGTDDSEDTDETDRCDADGEPAGCRAIICDDRTRTSCSSRPTAPAIAAIISEDASLSPRSTSDRYGVEM